MNASVAELAQRGGTHQLEKAQAGLAVFLPFKVCILLGQNGVPGISDSAVSLDVGIQHTVQVRGIACTLFPTKTIFFVRFARSVSRTESSCV